MKIKKIFAYFDTRCIEMKSMFTSRNFAFNLHDVKAQAHEEMRGGVRPPRMTMLHVDSSHGERLAQPGSASPPTAAHFKSAFNDISRVASIQLIAAEIPVPLDPSTNLPPNQYPGYVFVCVPNIAGHAETTSSIDNVVAKVELSNDRLTYNKVLSLPSRHAVELNDLDSHSRITLRDMEVSIILPSGNFMAFNADNECAMTFLVHHA